MSVFMYYFAKVVRELPNLRSPSKIKWSTDIQYLDIRPAKCVFYNPGWLSARLITEILP